MLVTVSSNGMLWDPCSGEYNLHIVFWVGFLSVILLSLKKINSTGPLCGMQKFVSI